MKKSILLAAFLMCGFCNFTFAGGCYKATIVSPSPFMGNNDEVFKLNNGTYWVVKYQYDYLYAYLPSVIICPSAGKLHINGKSLTIQPVR